MATLDSSARSNPDTVREIYGETDLTDAEINLACNAAYYLIQEVVPTAEISANLLATVEAYLATHFVAIRDPLLKAESMGGEFSATYDRGDLGEGLKSTQYGLTAIALDSTGKLADTGKRRAIIKVVSGDGDN